MIIDLRSDTITTPTEGMIKAMMAANVGDDVYKEDETVNILEERLASLFGKQTALFFPTGTMANQTAIKLHTNPGDQVICDKYAHIYNYEGGGASFNSGVSCKLIDGNRGMFTAKQVEEAINPPDFYHSPLTRLVEIENTTNKGGGACWDFSEIKKIRKICDANNLGFHLDGARLWNALISNNETAKQYGEQFDTISVCLSKGLGCPVGSVLIGDKVLMENAIRIRKILGGGMRQVGYLAAAGLYALNNHLNRLEVDHIKAKEIANTLESCSFIKSILPVETNIVVFKLDEKINSEDFIKQLEHKQIRISNMGNNMLRIITHLNYNAQMHTYFLNEIKNFRTSFFC